jgi:chromosomal replication initiation ATPase DnaA
MSPRVRSIIQDVADRWNVEFAAIMGERGPPRVSAARAAAMRALRKLSTGKQSDPFSYPAIGRLFNRHHTTVMAACGAIPAKGLRELSPACELAVNGTTSPHSQDERTGAVLAA